MKTQAEVEALKADWQRDPCWDLEETEGFEEYREELEAFSTLWQQEWERQAGERWREEARRMEASEATARRIVALEEEVRKLNGALVDLADRLVATEQYVRRHSHKGVA